jgi:hypothetical protein
MDYELPAADSSHDPTYIMSSDFNLLCDPMELVAWIMEPPHWVIFVEKNYDKDGKRLYIERILPTHWFPRPRAELGPNDIGGGKFISVHPFLKMDRITIPCGTRLAYHSYKGLMFSIFTQKEISFGGGDTLTYQMTLQ